MPVDRRPRLSATDRISASLRTRTALGRSVAGWADELRHRNVPVHWSNLFGVVAFACTIVLFVTGVILMFFYSPSGETVTYDGSYLPLQGAEVSKAFASTMAISLEVDGGLLLRQAHHWAALLLPTALTVQLLVTLFTGAFRRPRQGSWVLLFLLFIVAVVGGWSGYALPDDLLSGTGLRIVEGVALGIPVIGTRLSMLLFGAEFPGDIIEHLYPVHVAIVPVVMILIIAARGRSAYLNKPPQFAGPGRTEDNIVGMPMWPNAAARAGGLLSVVIGIIFLAAATVTISPVWLNGPASPGDASAGSQPDWYTGFLDGALRLVPPGWELEWLGHTWTLAVLVPLAAIGVFFAIVMLYPYLEGWVAGDRREHHILDRPRNAATRTGIGVAGIIFYGVLWGAASADVVSTHFQLSVEGVITTLQITLFAGPVIGFNIARRVCIALQKKDRELVLHGFETGRIVRLPGGEYVEVHQPVDEYERWRLISRDRPEPALRLEHDDDGRLPRGERLRVALSRWFFEDRVLPLAPPEPAQPERSTVKASANHRGAP
jgi:ubiquinol-cytochrome c reductase cytochrome b subunit